MRTQKLKTIDITLAGMFAALMAIGANITSWAPFLIVGGVPITLQTFFCVLAGLLLGKRLGAISMTVYALIGLAGAPIFARFSGGFGTIVSPTFGFILSFIATAYIVGLIVEKSKNPSTTRFVIAAIVGMAVNYIIGTNWMYFAYKIWAAAPEGFTYAMAWGWMAVPFPKDLILSILAGLFAPRVYRAINKTTSIYRQPAA